MATVHFELVSPEKKLVSIDVEQVVIPATTGDVGAMYGHVASFYSLRPGIITTRNGNDLSRYAVTSGFAEVTSESVSILAEEAIEKESLTRDKLTDLIKQAKETLEKADDNHKKVAEAQLYDLKNLEAVFDSL